MPVVAREVADARVGIVVLTQPERRQVRPAGQPLAALQQQREVVLVEIDSLLHHEQLTRLVEGEGEVLRAQFPERPPRAQPPEPDRGIDARRGDDAGVRRQVLDGVLERAKGCLVVEHVEVVQDDRHRLAIGRDAVQQLVHGRCDAGPRATQTPEGGAAETRPDAIDARRDVRPESRRVVVGGVERDPRDGRIGPRIAPRADEQALAAADGGADERQLGVGVPVERAEETRACDDVRPVARTAQLRLDERRLGRPKCLPPGGMCPSMPSALRRHA